MSLRGRVLSKEFSLTVTAGAYAIGDSLGGEINLEIKGTGRVLALHLTDDDNVKAALTARIFDGDITNVANDAAFAPTIGDLGKHIKKIAIASNDWETVNGNAVVNKDGQSVDFMSKEGLRLVLTTDATPTYTTTTAIKGKVTYWLD